MTNRKLKVFSWAILVAAFFAGSGLMAAGMYAYTQGQTTYYINVRNSSGITEVHTCGTNTGPNGCKWVQNVVTGKSGNTVYYKGTGKMANTTYAFEEMHGGGKLTWTGNQTGYFYQKVQ